MGFLSEILKVGFLEKYGLSNSKLNFDGVATFGTCFVKQMRK